MQRRGLPVPGIACTDRRSLRNISAEIRFFDGYVREGTLAPDKQDGATFIVSTRAILPHPTVCEIIREACWVLLSYLFVALRQFFVLVWL